MRNRKNFWWYLYKYALNTQTNSCGETYKFSECKSKRPVRGQKRLSSELTEKECKNAKTSDETKYKCFLSSNKKECEEVDKENSNRLKLSFTILCLLLFI